MDGRLTQAALDPAGLDPRKQTDAQGTHLGDVMPPSGPAAPAHPQNLVQKAETHEGKGSGGVSDCWPNLGNILELLANN